MIQFIETFLSYGFKFVVFILIACAGSYVGYRTNHKTEIYFKKQRKIINQYGKLVAYMYRHYKAANKKRGIRKYVKGRKREWLYTRCYSYVAKFERHEINIAKAYLKCDIKMYELFSLLVSVCVGLSMPVINTYAYQVALYVMKIKTTVGLADDMMKKFEEIVKCMENIFGIVYFVLIIVFLITMYNILKKQQYLLCIIEDCTSK